MCKSDNAQMRPLQSLAQGSAKQECNRHFCQIARNKRNDSCKQGGSKADVILEGKPDTAEKIAYGSAEYHAAQTQIPFIEPFINKKSRNQRHKNKADEIAAGRTEKLCGSTGEIRKYWESHKP